MSLSRAFTARRSAKTSDSSPEILRRNLTTKRSFSSGTIRHKISAPVELISTTNMLSYNAPDIFPSNLSTRSSNSGDDSDRSPSSTSTPLTSPDTSSIESSSPTSMEPNHLSCYFDVPSRQSASNDDVPTIPRRAPSHTKKNSEILARKRSTSRMSNSKSSISSIARSSINMFYSNIEIVDQHPFSNELAQVSELAEEYGISKEKLAVVDEEEQELISRGLFKFRAEDYMSEIQSLFVTAFGNSPPTTPPMWI